MRSLLLLVTAVLAAAQRPSVPPLPLRPSLYTPSPPPLPPPSPPPSPPPDLTPGLGIPTVGNCTCQYTCRASAPDERYVRPSPSPSPSTPLDGWMHSGELWLWRMGGGTRPIRTLPLSPLRHRTSTWPSLAQPHQNGMHWGGPGQGLPCHHHIARSSR